MELNDFHQDPVGWPWRALTTPNIDDYINWFKTNSYVVKKNQSINFQGTFFGKEEPISINTASTSLTPSGILT
ncbi:hypothetical protein [Legionella maioricensis]|uniref:Uncharacterized protein n=1 Tax=Legionella maioricensis TaxID=2896528 RepID=A0A9X2D0F3_9GAMM|nr:hypothetical protein [Legionella maioricensis]MCL9684219.1 hypothetical protein [Legionella maioricensis]MCL9687085.1 hypothetical protein [Legionella maioricensis]